MTGAAVPIPRIWTTGEVVTAAMLNASVRDAVQFLLAPPIAAASQATAQSLPNAAWSAVTYDTPGGDTYGGLTTTSRYTAQIAGYYHVAGSVNFAANSTGTRAITLYVNGAVVSGIQAQTLPAPSGFAPAIHASGRVYLNVGDYVQVMAYQSSGAALSTSNTVTTFGVCWVHA